MKLKSYLQTLPENRRQAMTKLRQVIAENLPTGFCESVSADGIAYDVPLEIYPDGYHTNGSPLPYLSITSLKNHVAIYHFGLYIDQKLMDWFKQAYSESVPNKIDMGKSCIRFKKVEQIPYQLIGELVAQRSVEQWVKLYDSVRPK